MSALAAAARASSTVQAITLPTWAGKGHGQVRAHCWVAGNACTQHSPTSHVQQHMHRCYSCAPMQLMLRCRQAVDEATCPHLQLPTLPCGATQAHPVVVHKLPLLRKEGAVGLLGDLDAAAVHLAVTPLRSGET